MAWVTHAGGEELSEWLAIRPTSEAIIAEKVKDWVQSYRDLPLLFNLWNNVVRWELRTRLFLRTTEFLWQEAHTFHATEQEALDEVAVGLECYRAASEDWLAIPVIKGRKTENEKFPGAVHTDAIESLMRDGKALQAGTSHMLGQNFAKAAGIQFLDRDNTLKNPYGTSWGFTTRMVGAAVMVHGDDSGLVLPPNVAPHQLVIVPIFRSEDDRVAVAAAIEKVEQSLAEVQTKSGPLRVKVDWRDESPGFKFNHWELRGVPYRLEIGPRDVAANQGVLVRRVDRQKEQISLDALAADLPGAAGRLPADALPARARLPRSQHAQGRFLRRVQGSPREQGRLHPGPLVRQDLMREADQRRHRREHPRHPVRLARGRGQVPRRRREVDAEGSVRARLLSRKYRLLWWPCRERSDGRSFGPASWS